MSYTVPNWQNFPSTATPLSAANLNELSNAITDLDTRNLTATAVQTSNYTASAGQLVPVNTTSNSVTITLPTAPADRTAIVVTHVIQGGSNTVTVTAGGTDVFNTSGGPTTYTLTLVNEIVRLQYAATGGIWYVLSGGSSFSSPLNVQARTIRLGTTNYDASIPSGGPNSAYIVLDKSTTGNDSSILLRDQGIQKAEVGIPGDDDLHLKTVTGSSESSLTFTDAIICRNATGYVYVPQRLGVGIQDAVEKLHVADTSATRVLNRVENLATSGSGSAGLYLVGFGGNWNVVNDVGTNGGNNLGFMSDTAGWPPVMIMTSGRLVGVNNSSPSTTLDVGGAFRTVPVALTDATTIAVNASLGNLFRVTLGGNRTMGAPSNPADGQKIMFEIIQDATGSRTMAWTSGAGGYAFGTTIPSPTLTTTANKRDFIEFIYNSTANLWYCLLVDKGY